MSYKKIRFEKNTFFRGGILGVPNIFSSFFLLGALAVFPAIMVYPAVNIGVILLAVLGAALIWKEKPDRYTWWGMCTGLIAIVLLGI